MGGRDSKGFTLIELLIVMAIIGILVGGILVAINPVGKLHEARNGRRWGETSGLLNALLNKLNDDSKTYDGETGFTIDADTSTVQVIVRTEVGATCTAGLATTPTCPGKPGGTTVPVTLTDCLVKLDNDVEDAIGLYDKYIAEIPIDPLGPGADPTDGVTDLPLGANNTGYYINKTGGGRLEIGACHPEQGETIKVKR